MSENKKAGRPQGSSSGMSRRELIREMSDVCQLKPDIVKNVLAAFSDIFIRETVANGAFHLSNCFVVETKERSARRAYNVHQGEHVVYPATKVLTIRLSPKINYMHRWKQRHENNAERGVTKDNWDSQPIELEEE